jgi:hypothetical protein
MSEASHPTADDEGGIVALLNGAAESFRTVAVTYRTWRHEQRLLEACRANSEKQKRRGVTFGAVGRGGPGASETQETVRIWREGKRARQEHHGGLRDGSYGVVDGPRWWSWSEQIGAMSNRDAPSVSGGGIDRGFEVMLNPAPLIDVLDFQVAGHSRIADRATLTAYATPRQDGLRDVKASSFPRVFRALHALGSGADSYHLEVDQQRGVLLATTAIHNEQPFYTITTLAIGIDEPIPADTFVFKPPDGEQIRSPLDHFAPPQFVPFAEALRRATFTVLVPDQLPTGWRQVPRCASIEASVRFPASVVLFYGSDAGHQRFSIRQMAAAHASQSYRGVLDDESWHEVRRGGTPIKIQPTAQRLYAQAHLTRHGTFAYLNSEGLTTEELTIIAASLRPAPNTNDA